MKKVLLLVGGVAVSCVALAIACGTDAINYTCAGDQTCPVPDGGAPPEDGSTIDSASGDAGAGGDGSTCDKTQTPSQSGCVIADGLAIFVAPSGSDSNAGTKEAPVATISQGITLALASSTHRVIACASTYAEALTLTAPTGDVGLGLFGGVVCPGSSSGTAWSYTGAQAVVKAPGSAPALQATGLTKPIVVQDVELDGPAVTAAGASSIGAFLSSVTSAGFTNVKMVAQSGTNGADGTTGDNYADAGVASGNPASDDGGVPTPGAAVTCTCEDGTQTVGAPGGGGPQDAGAGAGLPQNGGGAGGTNGIACSGGGLGSNGNDGPVAVTDAGTPTQGILSSTGWMPGNGANGANGLPGQGGGGGGDGTSGGAGGGGACGGCGGAGGSGGHAGGSSIALLEYQSAVTLTTCKLVAGSAGSGGKGATGQAGEGGSNGVGLAVGNACVGGAGGAGAGGNGGSGGAGGVSVGVLYAGTPPTIDGMATSSATTLPIVTLGSAGDAGAAGAGGTHAQFSANAGVAGQAGVTGSAQAVMAGP